MIFIPLVIIIALALATVSGAFSIIGMAATFPSIFWSIVSMGIVLEAGKLSAASFIYRYWRYAPKSLSIPMIVFVVVLIVISITGHFGYLSKGYQQDSLPLQQISAQVTQLEQERTRKIERKKEIDVQISQLPTDRVISRIRLSKQFNSEQVLVTSRINELDGKILELKSKQIEAVGHVGPITYISSALGITTDEGVKWFIFLIVSVFDPLALALTVSVSVMLKHKKDVFDGRTPGTKLREGWYPTGEVAPITGIAMGTGTSGVTQAVADGNPPPAPPQNNGSPAPFGITIPHN